MPAYTLGELISSATANVGRRSDIPASEVSRIVNEAYFDVFYSSSPQEGEKHAVSSTTTGVYKVELPNDFYEPISAFLVWQSGATSGHSSHMTLRLVSTEQVDGRNPQPSGTPKDIAFFNSWAELWPSPNSAFSFHLRYKAHPSDLTASTAVPSLSTPWRKAVLLKAEEMLFKYIHDEVGESNAQMAYLEYVNRMHTDEARRQVGHLRHNVNPSWGLGGRRRT